VTAPVEPAEASANTKAGAIAFVKYYVELINHAQATGDTAALAAAEDPRCGACASGRKYLTSVYTRGGRIRGGTFESRVVQAIPRAAHGDWLIAAVLKSAPEVVSQPWSNPPTRRLKGGSSLANFFPSFATGRWVINAWKVTQ
jgi:hypothetical protein